MENASKALLIAAGVLVGVIILSIGVALMHTMGGYAANTQNRIDENRISQFNDEFLRYNGLKDLNIHDVITVKNYAIEHNKQYLGYDVNNDRAQENNDYIDVFYGERNKKVDLVLGVSDHELLKNEMDKLYTCEVQISSITGKVSKVYFYETK